MEEDEEEEGEADTGGEGGGAGEERRGAGQPAGPCALTGQINHLPRAASAAFGRRPPSSLFFEVVPIKCRRVERCGAGTAI